MIGACARCHDELRIHSRGLCKHCYGVAYRSDSLDRWRMMTPDWTDETVYCRCRTPNYDVIDQCRCCRRADRRAPRIAAVYETTAERLGLRSLSAA